MAKSEQTRVYCEPAASIIEKLGGVLAVSGACEYVDSYVYRWRLSKRVGGFGGRIPQPAQFRIVDAMRDGRLPNVIGFDEFFVREEEDA